MRTEKLVDQSDVVMPVIAALPFAISLTENEATDKGTYNPELQLTTHSASGYSTSQEDDSAGGIFSTKRDTKKDD
jgi:hypothetical protein